MGCHTTAPDKVSPIKLHGSSARKFYSPLQKYRSVFLSRPVQACLGMDKPVQTADQHTPSTFYPILLGIPQEPGHHACWCNIPHNRRIGNGLSPNSDMTTHAPRQKPHTPGTCPK
ncbi:Hypothetical predicted protein [Pelobates cultripes]|uniref:Uncharacterized protein n=1 Tax=Pelobates cultripes TaxID=61616 RepID=A0AAD1RMX4_PELCU|nr:Hypothetical predicted protein [Pelobates cultripes]